MNPCIYHICMMLHMTEHKHFTWQAILHHITKLLEVWRNFVNKLIHVTNLQWMLSCCDSPHSFDTNTYIWYLSRRILQSQEWIWIVGQSGRTTKICFDCSAFCRLLILLPSDFVENGGGCHNGRLPADGWIGWITSFLLSDTSSFGRKEK